MKDCTFNYNYVCPTTGAGPIYKWIGICIESVVYCLVVFLNTKADPLHIWCKQWDSSKQL